jgi:hypothetical protein
VLVFIRLLPESVTQNELRRFVSNGLRSRWLIAFPVSGKIRSVEIRKFTNGTSRSVEYHGIVDIEPAKAAVKAIRKLNRTLLKGKEVEVRKYYQRSVLRDRRIAMGARTPSDERRKRDRRRGSMVMERVSVSGHYLAPSYA